MKTPKFRQYSLSQSTLVIASYGLWSEIWRELKTGTLLTDVWEQESWEKAPTMLHLRALHRHAEQTPFGTHKMVALAHADILSKEVANSLLKLLEEPPAYLFSILFAESENVLPTILSRVQVLRLGTVSGGQTTSRDQLAKLLNSYSLESETGRKQAREMLFAAPLIHASVQIPVIEEGFRPHK